MASLASSHLHAYNADGTLPFPSWPSQRRASVKSLDENDKFTAQCNGALAKIRLAYLRLLARDKVDANREVVVRRRNSKVTPVHQLGKPAQFARRTVTRTVSFTN